MAEQKAVCGGFIVGEGLKMEGKVLSADGEDGRIALEIEIDGTNDTWSYVDPTITDEYVANLIMNNKNVVLCCYDDERTGKTLFYPMDVNVVDAPYVDYNFASVHAFLGDVDIRVCNTFYNNKSYIEKGLT